MIYSTLKNSKGYITLISVTIIGAAATAIVIYLLLSGTATTQNSLINLRSAKARSLANACAEEALQQIRDNNTFSGTNSLSLADGICTYTVTNPGGTNRNILASSSVFATTRKIRVTTTSLSPRITISSWQEVGD